MKIRPLVLFWLLLAVGIGPAYFIGVQLRGGTGPEVPVAPPVVSRVGTAPEKPSATPTAGRKAPQKTRTHQPVPSTFNGTYSSHSTDVNEPSSVVTITAVPSVGIFPLPRKPISTSTSLSPSPSPSVSTSQEGIDASAPVG